MIRDVRNSGMSCLLMGYQNAFSRNMFFSTGHLLDDERISLWGMHLFSLPFGKNDCNTVVSLLLKLKC